MSTIDPCSWKVYWPKKKTNVTVNNFSSESVKISPNIVSQKLTHAYSFQNTGSCALPFGEILQPGGVKGTVILQFYSHDLSKHPAFGFGDNLVGVEEESLITADKAIEAKQRQVMAIAYAPGKNLLSTAFMLWMSGSSIQIFSIMMTGMALINPMKAIVGVNQAFSKFSKEEGVDLRFPKLIFLGLQMLSVAVALYKCSTMGLLPVTSADWTSLLPEKHFMEFAATHVQTS